MENFAKSLSLKKIDPGWLVAISEVTVAITRYMVLEILNCCLSSGKIPNKKCFLKLRSNFHFARCFAHSLKVH